MDKYEVYEGTKKRSNILAQKNFLKILRIFMIVLIILMILFVFVKLLSDRSGISNSVYSNKTEDYIYAVDSDSVLDIKSFNDGIAVLTNNSVIYVNKSGSSVSKNSHKYSNPVISVGRNRILLYDRGAHAYRVENAGGILQEGKTDSIILTGYMSENGSYAVAEKGTDSLSSVSVYNSKYRLDFRWNCASEYIVDVSISSNGNNIAVLVMNSSNAAVYSKMYLFNSKNTEPLCCYDYSAAMYSVDFVSENKLIAVGENLIDTITKKDKETVYTFTASSGRRTYFDRNSGNTSVVIAKYGNDNSEELNIFGKNGNTVAKKTFTKTVNLVECNSKYFTVLFNDCAETYNMSGKKIGSIDFSDSAIDFELDGSNLYILYSNGIAVYNIKENISIKNPVIEKKTQPASSTSETETSKSKPIAAFSEPGTTIKNSEG